MINHMSLEEVVKTYCNQFCINHDMFLDSKIFALEPDDELKSVREIIAMGEDDTLYNTLRDLLFDFLSSTDHE